MKPSPIFLSDSTAGDPSMNISSILEDLTMPKPVINDELYFYLMFILQGTVCQAITIFGIFTNIINVIIFVKQGFSDTINVSLLALSISDLSSLLLIMWTNLCFSPAIRDSNIPMVTTEVHLITGTWPHIVFTRITGWITAFISLERCVCVIQPLKVKTMFTRKRHVIAMVAIFTLTMGLSSFGYIPGGLGWKFYPDRNKTLIGIAYHLGEDGRKYTDAVSYAISGIFMPISCFLSVVILTTILVVKLNQKMAWRQSNSSAVIQSKQKSTSDGVVNSKERKIAKMVVLMSVIFIASFLPAVIVFFTGIIVPTFNYDKLDRNLVFVMMSLTNTAEVINSSVNIFIYIRMSSKYRETFLKLFKLKTTVNNR
ncbi:unnamed protein product [Candidula unifasciata]|uniref:G-protein coupled receptors family 1 profile domain-containing protein n=1 Tax=Candidula unifasciata TaxID=100452 RepID=A0A8S3ZMD4_9EUPU|nr:unnamed protein product [Candidula unifasciata]